MAIDADLHAGAIDEDEARRRRQEVADEADFYGAMDGASKFVRGDAIAAIVITAVNLIGGLAIGVAPAPPLAVRRHLHLQPALGRRRVGLADPGAAAVPLDRHHRDPGRHRARPRSRRLDPAVALPADRADDRRCHGCAWPSSRACRSCPSSSSVGPSSSSARACPRTRPRRSPRSPSRRRPSPPPTPPSRSPPASRVEQLVLELGLELIDLVQTERGGDLLDRVKSLRRNMATELGIVMPQVHTRDNLDLPPSVYAIRVQGVEVARGEAPRGKLLAVGHNLDELAGVDTRDPAFGGRAKWIPAELQPSSGRGRRHRGGPLGRSDHPPGRGRPRARRYDPVPPGHQAAARCGQDLQSGRARGDGRRRAHPRRRPGRAPRPARRGGPGARPGAHRRVDHRAGAHAAEGRRQPAGGGADRTGPDHRIAVLAATARCPPSPWLPRSSTA